MPVVAKFFVQKLSVYAHAPEAKEVVLAAVSRGEENRSWAQYTPSGQITMSIKSEAAAGQFEIGKEYLVTFEAV